MVLANKRETIFLKLYYNSMVKTMFCMKRNNWLQYLIYLVFKSALGDRSHFLSISRPNLSLVRGDVTRKLVKPYLQR